MISSMLDHPGRRRRADQLSFLYFSARTRGDQIRPAFLTPARGPFTVVRPSGGGKREPHDRAVAARPSRRGPHGSKSNTAAFAESLLTRSPAVGIPSPATHSLSPRLPNQASTPRVRFLHCSHPSTGPICPGHSQDSLRSSASSSHSFIVP